MLSLGVSHMAFSREAGIANHLCAQEEKEGDLLYEHESGSATSWAQAQPQRLFTFTAREPPVCMFFPPHHASEVRGQWQGAHSSYRLEPTVVLQKGMASAC